MLTADDIRTIEIETARSELLAVETELTRRRWLADPEAWALERLNETLWSGQSRILRAVRDHRRTAVPSCHEASKTYTASLVVGWWLDCHLPGEAFVVTSAPTDPQVRAILWREIGRMHSRGQLRGRVNQTEWHLKMPGGNEEMIAFGRKPSDYNPTAFQGIHARYVLVVLDEASGIRELWDAADSLIANDGSKMLVTGNPDDPTSEFKKICTPGSGYHVIHISAFDTPNFTGEELPDRIKQHLIGRTYVEERRRKWAPRWRWTADLSRVEPPPGVKVEDSHPFWQSKILGIFPSSQTDQSLIPIAWITAAQQRTLTPTGPSELGVDVGGGSDESTGCHRRGGVFRILWSDQNPDTMHTCGIMISHLRNPLLRITSAKVDEIGIGRGVADRGKELNSLGEISAAVYGINVGESPSEAGREYFVNRRSEDMWAVRTLFEEGKIDIDAEDEELAAELATVRFKRMSNGKIQIESKLDAKARGVPSPNRVDSLVLSNAQPREEMGEMEVVKLAGFG